MAFKTPTMNLAVNIWHGNTIPPTGPPDVVTVGNLRPLYTGNVVVQMLAASVRYCSTLALPKGTDVRPRGGLTDGFHVQDKLEVPAGSGRYYACEEVEDVGRGFPNEYRGTIIRQVLAPIPIP